MKTRFHRLWAAAMLGAFFHLTAQPGLAQRAGQPSAPPATAATTARNSGASMFGGGAASPIVLPDRRVTFNLAAPGAQKVQLTSPDFNLSGGPIQFVNLGPEFVKNDQGAWTVTVGPLQPGVFRYTFLVDGVSTADPRNSETAEDLSGVESLLRVPGSGFMDIKAVPHGLVSKVWYPSAILGRTRRMHVYTPPGYATSSSKYPVFYLLHGAGGSDEAWSSVGAANFILDNLIASGKAKPMIVVMPDGHVGSEFNPATMGQDEFPAEFLKEILPFVEKNFRAKTDRPSRAIAGLSMGGVQTLEIALPNLEKFAAIGVFSSGWFNGADEVFLKAHGPALDKASSKKGLKVFWTGVGKDDFLANPATQTMLNVLRARQFKPDHHATEGGHDWVTWQKYLAEFAPLLFR